MLSTIGKLRLAALVLGLAVNARTETWIKVTEYPVPGAEGGTYEITAGPDGALWFTEQLSGKIGRITTGGSITEYAIMRGSIPELFPYSGLAANQDIRK